MTTLNEISLQQLASDQAQLSSRIFQLGQGLHTAIENNNQHVVRYVKEAQADTTALVEVLDSTLRLLFGNPTDDEKEGLVKHVNSFLSRKQ